MTRKSKPPALDVKAFLAEVDGGRTISEFHKGRVIFRQGDPAESVFYIQKGKAKITVTSKRGKDAVIGVLEQGDFFGEGCLGGQTLRMATASALTDCAVMQSEKRLARTLLLLANFGKKKVSEPEPVLEKIDQATLADIIGTTRARVSFFMNKFRRLGLIDYNGKIVIHPALLNLVLHEKPEIRKAPV